MLPVSDDYCLAFAEKLALRAGRYAVTQFRHVDAWQKDNATFVTQADVDIQTDIERAIFERFPDHAVLGEERTKNAKPTGEEPVVWVVDPIDGTESYLNGLPIWGISIALFVGGKPRVGVFHLPLLGETYSATRDGEAMLTLHAPQGETEARAIHVNPDPTINGRSVLFVPSDFHRHFTSLFPGKQRSLGSIAAHACIVARGAAQGAVMNPYLWDVAAVGLILERAGGRLLNLESGEPMEMGRYLNGSRMPFCLAAANITSHAKFKPLLTRR